VLRSCLPLTSSPAACHLSRCIRRRPSPTGRGSVSHRGLQRLDRARGRPERKPKTADDRAAQIDPIITFLRGGLDALKETRTTRQR